MNFHGVEALRCPECGAAWGSGCSCADNLRAIARGERRKAREEELEDDDGRLDRRRPRRHAFP